MVKSYQEQVADSCKRDMKRLTGLEKELAWQYYHQIYSGVASQDWDTFKNSWAGQLWIARKNG